MVTQHHPKLWPGRTQIMLLYWYFLIMINNVVVTFEGSAEAQSSTNLLPHMPVYNEKAIDFSKLVDLILPHPSWVHFRFTECLCRIH